MTMIGWVTSERVVQADRPNKRVYSLTPEGKDEFQKWLAMPSADIESAMRAKSAFLMRVFFAGETSDEEALQLLYKYRGARQEHKNVIDGIGDRISYYEEQLEDGGRRAKHWELAALHGEIFWKAGMEWVEQAIAILEREE
jgi:DNA-binding PadR family transcriptional regulator